MIIISFFSIYLTHFWKGKRSAPVSAKTQKKKSKGDDDEDVRIVPDDLETIDVSNIIPRTSRNAARASGLATYSSSSSSKPSTSSKSQHKSSTGNGNQKATSKSKDDDDSEEAEF